MPESVISPVVAVADKAPVTVDAANAKPASLTTVAAPLPLVSSATVPSTAKLPKLTTPLLASVVADKLPPMVKVPLSVIPDALPLVRVKSPSTVDAAISKAVVPPSMVTSASVPEPSLVVKVMAPVKALVVTSSTMVASFALVVKADVPVIAKAPESVILPVVAVTDKSPATDDAPKAIPPLPPIVTSPLVVVLAAILDRSFPVCPILIFAAVVDNVVAPAVRDPDD